MERRWLAILVYFSGWCVLSTHLFQYHYVPVDKTWMEARTYCREKYKDLATIKNAEMLKLFYTTSKNIRAAAWIGLYCKFNWTWSDGHSGNGTDFRNWARQNIKPANYRCALMGSSGMWSSESCKKIYPFICYNGTQQFVYVNKAVTWSSAQSYCRNIYKDLATVTSMRDNEKAYYSSLGTMAWIGLYTGVDDYWSDESQAVDKTWSECKKQSFIHHSGTCYSVMLTWNLRSCEMQLPFYCYSVPPAKQQIFKLRVKVGKSSADPNDPAAKQVLLQQIRDRLEEKGLMGIKLTWREQPDGNVFHKEEGGSRQKKKKKNSEL